MQYTEPRHVADQDARIRRDCDRRRTDRGRLIDKEQRRPVVLQSVDKRAQLDLVVGQPFVEQALHGAVDRDRVMCTFPASTPMNTSTLSFR